MHTTMKMMATASSQERQMSRRGATRASVSRVWMTFVVAACLLAAPTPAHGTRGHLAKQDRSLAGTVVTGNGVFDPVEIHPGAVGSKPSKPVLYNGKLYFGADDGVTGRELWGFDGTSAALVADLWGDGQGGSAGGSDPYTEGAVVFQNKLYFSAKLSTPGQFDYIGRELVVMDENEDVSLVADLCPGTCEGLPRYLTVLGGRLYFAAIHPTLGHELWAYDGVNPPAVVADIVSSGEGSIPRHLTAHNGKLYFYAGAEASDPTGGELYAFDPSDDTFSVVADIHVGGGWSRIEDIYVHGSTLYLVANDFVHGHELWTYDEVNGAQLVKDIYTGAPSSTPKEFVSNGAALFFSAETADEGRELHVLSSGVERIVSDHVPGTDDSNPSAGTVHGGSVYVIASGPNGRELHRVDTNELVRVSDLNSGAGSSFAEFGDGGWLVSYGGKLLFASDDGSTGLELWTFAVSTVSCAAGEHPAVDTDGFTVICADCPAGTFSEAGDTECSLCAAGTYAAGTGNTVCQTCAAGTFSSPGASSCGICGAGTIAGVTPGTCEICPAGTYEDGTRTSCEACPTGSVSSAGATSCSPCQDGFITNGAQSVCAMCPGGTYEDGTHSSCETCPAGSYSSSGATSCTTCADGTIAPNAGSSSCTACGAGTIENNHLTCDTCPAGSTSSSPAASDCDFCLPGYEWDGDSCEQCQAGTSQPNSALQPSCSSCASGYISGVGAATCSQCPAGTEENSHLTCDTCPGGMISSAGSSCTLCPAGTREENHLTCADCAAGTFSNAHGSSTCTACPSGQWSAEGSTSCAACPAGEIVANGGASCEPCGVGFYPNVAGTVCIACPTGSSTNGEGGTACDFCAPGYEWDGDSCEQCSPGYEQPLSAHEPSCGSCDAGYVAPNFGTSSCTACPAGTEEVARTSCTICAAGSVTTVPGMTACSVCPAGTKEVARMSCDDCPAGYYSNSVGSTACSICPSGSFSTEGSTGCTACPSGHYSAIPGSGTCSECPAGTFMKVDQTGCDVCPTGSTSAAGSAECNICEPGYGWDGDSCELCSNGEEQPLTAEEATCSACDPGFISTGGDASCSPCNAGEYEDSNTCLTCPAGSSSSSGSTVCNICLPGYGWDGSDCVSCTAGTAQGSTGAALLCSACGPGYRSDAGATTCLPCGIGEFEAGDNNVCQTCPTGSSTTSTASTTCDTCNAGYELILGTCEECGIGYYKSGQSSSACTQCPIGSTTTSTGSTSINDCFCSGNFYDASGSTSDGDVTCSECTECTGNLVRTNRECTAIRDASCASRIFSSWPRRSSPTGAETGLMNAAYPNSDVDDPSVSSLRGEECSVIVDFTYSDLEAAEGAGGAMWFRILSGGNVLTTFKAPNQREMRLFVATWSELPVLGVAPNQVTLDLEYFDAANQPANEQPETEPSAASLDWTPSTTSSTLDVIDECLTDYPEASVLLREDAFWWTSDVDPAGARTGVVIQGVVDRQLRSQVDDCTVLLRVVARNNEEGGARRVVIYDTQSNFAVEVSVNNFQSAIVQIDGSQSPLDTGTHTFQARVWDDEDGWEEAEGSLNVLSTCRTPTVSLSGLIADGYPRAAGDSRNGILLQNPFGDGRRGSANGLPSCDVVLDIIYNDPRGVSQRTFKIVETTSGDEWAVDVTNGQIVRVVLEGDVDVPLTALEFELQSETSTTWGVWGPVNPSDDDSQDTVLIGSVASCPSSLPTLSPNVGSVVPVAENNPDGNLYNAYGSLRNENCDAEVTVTYLDVHRCSDNSERRFILEARRIIAPDDDDLIGQWVITLTNGYQATYNLGDLGLFEGDGDAVIALFAAAGSGEWTNSASLTIDWRCASVDTHVDAEIILTPSGELWADAGDGEVEEHLSHPFHWMRTPVNPRVSPSNAIVWGSNDDVVPGMIVKRVVRDVIDPSAIAGYETVGTLQPGDYVVAVHNRNEDTHRDDSDSQRFLLRWWAYGVRHYRAVTIPFGKSALVRLHAEGDASNEFATSLTPSQIDLLIYSPEDYGNQDDDDVDDDDFSNHFGWVPVSSPSGIGFLIHEDAETYETATLLDPSFPVPNYQFGSSLSTVIGDYRTCDGSIVLVVQSCGSDATGRTTGGLRSYLLRDTLGAYERVVWIEGCEEVAVIIDVDDIPSGVRSFELLGITEGSFSTNTWTFTPDTASDIVTVSGDSYLFSFCFTPAMILTRWDYDETFIDTTGVFVTGPVAWAELEFDDDDTTLRRRLASTHPMSARYQSMPQVRNLQASGTTKADTETVRAALQNVINDLVPEGTVVAVNVLNPGTSLASFTLFTYPKSESATVQGIVTKASINGVLVRSLAEYGIRASTASAVQLNLGNSTIVAEDKSSSSSSSSRSRGGSTANTSTATLFGVATVGIVVLGVFVAGATFLRRRIAQQQQMQVDTIDDASTTDSSAIVNQRRKARKIDSKSRLIGAASSPRRSPTS